MTYRRFSPNVIALAVVVGLMTIGTTLRANAQIIPVAANAYGNTYSDWSAAWWQWLLSIPKATNPDLDTTGANCAQGQNDPGYLFSF